MTSKQAIIKLRKKCFTGDTESDHCEADNILCELLRSLGCGDVVDLYKQVDKWFS